MQKGKMAIWPASDLNICINRKGKQKTKSVCQGNLTIFILNGRDQQVGKILLWEEGWTDDKENVFI